MDEAPPFPYRPERAARLRPVLEAVLGTALAWAAERRSP
jgi:N-formylglutamate amidohydrolase